LYGSRAVSQITPSPIQAGQRSGEIPGQTLVRDELQRAVEIGAGAVDVTERDLGAGAVEQGLAALRLVEAGRGQRGIERLQGPRRLACRQPGIARLGAVAGPAGIAGRLGLLGRLGVDRRRRRPLLLRGEGEAEAAPRRQPAGAPLRNPGLGLGCGLLRRAADQGEAGVEPVIVALRRGGGRIGRGRLQGGGERNGG